jgi:hypothetical protein
MQQDIHYIVGKIVLVSDEPFPTILEAAYYVNRGDFHSNPTAFAAERDMLQHLVYSRALSGEMRTLQTAWRVVEELMDVVEENPREESAGG